MDYIIDVQTLLGIFPLVELPTKMCQDRVQLVCATHHPRTGGVFQSRWCDVKEQQRKSVYPWRIIPYPDTQRMVYLPTFRAVYLHNPESTNSAIQHYQHQDSLLPPISHPRRCNKVANLHSITRSVAFRRTFYVSRYMACLKAERFHGSTPR